jgi:cysteine-rich repeat protein
VLAVAGRAAAALYTVAASGGDFTSVQAALDVAVAGDTIQVRQKPTPYFEKIAFPRSGDAGSGYITLEVYPGEAPILDGTGVPGADMVRIDSRSYVKIVGFEIRNNLGVDDGSGVRVLGSGSHIEIRDNTIHDIRDENAMGITVYGTAADPISDLIIDGNEIYDCEPAPSEALTLNGNVTDFAVTNNSVHDVDNIGIDLIGGESSIQPDLRKVARNGVVRGNTVARARSSYGGGFGAGIYVDGGRDIVVENNVVTECDLGLEVGAEHAGVNATGIVVRSNVLYANDKAGLVFGGYSSKVGRVRHSTFRNNTLYGNDTLGAGFGELWIQFADGNTVDANIVYGTRPRLLTSEEGNVDNDVGGNIFFAPGGPSAVEFLWKGTLYTVFSDFLDATSSSSSFVDPLFANPAAGDFHIGAASYAIDYEDEYVPAPGEVDLDGAPRSNGPRVDAGADESTICGNGIHEFFEECDDGNVVDGDGCDSNCTHTGCGNRIVTPPEQCDDGSPYNSDCCIVCGAVSGGCDDGNACTTADTCTGGTCVGVEAPLPPGTCLTALKGDLKVLRPKSPAQNQLSWGWKKGAEVDLLALADPTDPLIHPNYAVCVYDTSGPSSRVVAGGTLPAAGVCGGKPCWSPVGNGWRYRDKEALPDGITSMTIKAGAAGKSSIKLKAKGSYLDVATLPLTQSPAVTVQLSNGIGTCFESVFTPPATKNDAGQFKDAIK